MAEKDWLNVEIEFEGEDASWLRSVAERLGEPNYAKFLASCAIIGAAELLNRMAA